MQGKEKNRLKGKELRTFCMFSAALLFVAAFAMGNPKEILTGMWTIIYSRDALVTDYFELAGYGAAFFNAGLMMVVGIALVEINKIP